MDDQRRSSTSTSVLDRKQQVSVALLFDRIELVKQWTHLFRQIDIVPYFYENLDEFWYGVMEHPPTLALVDLRLTQQNDRQLKNHPMFKQKQAGKELSLAIFYEEATREFLISGMDAPHIGLVDAQADWATQIRSLLIRAKEVQDLRNERDQFERKSKKIESQFDKLITTCDEFRELNFYQKRLKKIINLFEEQRKQDRSGNIFDYCAKIFSLQDWVESFTMIEIAPGGKKLISYAVDKLEKYQSLPPVWLGDKEFRAIDVLGQNMANQVALESLGPGLATIGLYADESFPEKLLVLKVKDKRDLQSFDWKGFEYYISGIFSQSKLMGWGALKLNQGRFLNPWHFLQIVDNHYYQRSNAIASPDSELVIGALSFDAIWDLLQAPKQNRFQWDKCINDFLIDFNKAVSASYDLSFFNEKTLVFLFEKSVADVFFHSLKNHAQHFHFWRYFDDFEAFIKDDIAPELRMLPCSRFALLQQVQEKVSGRRGDILQKAEEKPFADKFFVRTPPQISQ